MLESCCNENKFLTTRENVGYTKAYTARLAKCNHLNDFMKPILIHIHLYYADMWPEMKAVLEDIRSMGYNTALVVTLPHSASRLEQKIEETYPDARIWKVPNQGYDIAPFVKVLQSVNLDEYSYVIKLHTKREMPGDVFLDKMPFNYGGSRWRDYLLNFCREGNLKKSLLAFEYLPDLGMVADYRVICRHAERRFLEPLKKIMQKTSIPMRDYAYVMGSMFMCRAELLQPLKQCCFQPEDFPAADAEHTENLAHVLERALGLVVAGQGYRIADVFSSRWEQCAFRRFLLHSWRFIYSSKRKKNGGLIIKIMKVPVYSCRK